MTVFAETTAFTAIFLHIFYILLFCTPTRTCIFTTLRSFVNAWTRSYRAIATGDTFLNFCSFLRVSLRTPYWSYTLNTDQELDFLNRWSTQFGQIFIHKVTHGSSHTFVDTKSFTEKVGLILIPDRFFPSWIWIQICQVIEIIWSKPFKLDLFVSFDKLENINIRPLISYFAPSKNGAKGTMPIGTRPHAPIVGKSHVISYSSRWLCPCGPPFALVKKCGN
mmetsp:Transcript_26058/g.26468  ORF Transcript_26058/g.26468 Transcript_26058/m.26468 type:complete len:221 (-) Transcript_26058:162-824(-)